MTKEEVDKQIRDDVQANFDKFFKGLKLTKPVKEKALLVLEDAVRSKLKLRMIKRLTE